MQFEGSCGEVKEPPTLIFTSLGVSFITKDLLAVPRYAVVRLFSWFVLAVFIVISAMGQEHWAYEMPVKVEVQGHPVDTLLSRVRDQMGTRSAELAEPAKWVERAAYTLTGLPPSPDHIARIKVSPDEETWSDIIDELLESPAYGERWARHWMDVARYADTFGYNFMKDNRLPYAWTYRDWLINAFNGDVPWAEFIKLQVAADLIVEKSNDPDLAALGFLTIGPRGKHEVMVDDRVDVVTRGFMGTTVSCARCHDHKTDPISMTDYYSFYSILDNITVETTKGPVIGKPTDPDAHEDFLKKRSILEDKDHKVRQEFLDNLRGEKSLAIYLELAWSAKKEDWDIGKADSEGFKRGRYRGKAIVKWAAFLDNHLNSAEAHPILKKWDKAMKDGGNPDRLCGELATELVKAMSNDGEGALSYLVSHPDCPLSVGIMQLDQFFDQKDGDANRERVGKMDLLEATHDGAPPRAMIVREKKKWSQAHIFERGDPKSKGDSFERHWLTVLGGGQYVEGLSPRMQMANKIATPDNPLTGRVIVNRVWAWHFGEPLADPGDFGPQQPEPLQQELLDWLAVWFWENGGSLKKLHRLLLTSEAYRLSANGLENNNEVDQANTSYWKWNRRRLDFESMRDSILLTSGALEVGSIGGRSVDLDTAESDERRSVYAFVDRYALPGLLVNFDLPHPDHHSAGRVETIVPQQALFFLNGRMPLRQARELVDNQDFIALKSKQQKIAWLYERIMRRSATDDEARMMDEWISAAREIKYKAPPGGSWRLGWVDANSSNVKQIKNFPIFDGGTWKTGKDLSKAPIKWLSAGSSGGHANKDYALVLRWTASSAGEYRLAGNINRKGKQGPALLCQIANGSGETINQYKLPQAENTKIEGMWQELTEGQTMDFIVRAPDGHNTGSFDWNLRVLGRDEPGASVIKLAVTGKDIPDGKNRSVQPISTGDVWCDLVQILWASNEFNFVD